MWVYVRQLSELSCFQLLFSAVFGLPRLTKAPNSLSLRTAAAAGNLSQIFNTGKFNALLFNDNKVIKMVDPLPAFADVEHLVDADTCAAFFLCLALLAWA